jgi:hypothetical protein
MPEIETMSQPDTLQAYRETHYEVHADDALGSAAFSLKIDAVCEELMKVYAHHEVDCSAYLTACNPYSDLRDENRNPARQAALHAEIEKRGLRCFPGFGKHPTGPWPGEDSFLVLGLSLEDAKALGRQFEQNAIVWCGADAVPKLILLR